MNRKLTTILAGLSTAAAFAVNGSDWLHGGLSFWYRCWCAHGGNTIPQCVC